MKFKLYICSFVALFAMHTVKAQYTMFSKSGTITYDKTMYMKNIVNKQFIDKADERSRAQFQNMLPKIPQQVVLKKTLKFNDTETLFEPQKVELDQMTQQLIMMFALDFDAVTLSNLKTREYKRYNDLMGEKVIIQDTVKKVKWRITNEYREIAGYSCRRANGITPDSVYVVAYYNTEMPVSGGPESISGLPGMILGLVVPSQHVSYFASKVELSTNVPIDKKVFDTKKVKVMTRQQMIDQFSSTLKDWLNKETVDYIMKLGTL
ncbi:GLPGLI family protein [Sphingobacterium paludis]|uniref:GLPGLI family protein n=1 Tax=Sphingobacterium paludis TaxID=1476465 RepID=A0A4V3E193_9SPHI|nr:GLPGLI family protein [Sphingobacterium paludis]TDS12328.1 GLPGLI family protein [Sphingobacterium paludis]